MICSSTYIGCLDKSEGYSKICLSVKKKTPLPLFECGLLQFSDVYKSFSISVSVLWSYFYSWVAKVVFFLVRGDFISLVASSIS